MKRLAQFVLPALALLGLGLAPAAQARTYELGSAATAVASKCPGAPCEVLARTTGYMGRSDNVRNPFIIPRAGYVTSFTVTLAPLADNQIQFFNDTYGDPPRVRLSILRRSKKRKTRLNHRLLYQSPVFNVQPYIDDQRATTPSFVLQKPLRVRAKYIVALTTSTLVPAFVGGVSTTNWWRSSRASGRCGSQYVSQRSAQETPGRVRKFGCTYKGARLMYTANYVPDPRPVKR